MKKKFTFLPLRKKLFASKRRGMSGILEAMLLIGIVIVGTGIVVVYLSEMNFENLSCEIQFFKVYQVSNEKYWVELILHNNGDYTFDGSLKYFDEITITDLSHDILNEIKPNDKVNLEFAFTGVIGDYITMGFDVTTDDQKVMCTKKVKV